MLLGLLLSSMPFATSALAAPLTEQQKIDALIHSVEVLPGTKFIRNGVAYDGKAAADHLQEKRRYAGSNIKTANDFIACCASKSSMSGLPYRIQYANGMTLDAEVYFRAELKRIETPPPAPIVAPIPAPTPIPVSIAVPVPAPALAPHSNAHATVVHRHTQHHHATTTQKRPS